MTDLYVIPSLLDLSVHRMTTPPGFCPPCQDLAPLPPHLKDALREILTKRGQLTGPQLRSLLHPRVRQVDLSDCTVTDSHVLALAASCPGLVKLNINQVQYRAGLASRKSSGAVAEPEPRQQQVGQEALTKLLAQCRHLSVAYLRGLSGVTDTVVSVLATTARHLTHLDLGGCVQVGDLGLESLSRHCPGLLSLSLARTRVTDAGLAALARATCRNRLQELRIDSCRNVSDDGVEILLDGVTSLRILIFHGCPRVTERTRVALETYLAMNGQVVKQLTWTVY